MCKIWSRPYQSSGFRAQRFLIWSQVTSDCFWASSLLAKEHDFKKMAMKEKFSKHTRFDTVCATKSEHIDRSQWRMQDANLAGLEHISMVRIFVAGTFISKMIRMKAQALSDSALCVGVSNSDPSNNGATNLKHVWNEHGFLEHSVWQPQMCNSFGTYYRCFHHWHRGAYSELRGQNPESFDGRIIFHIFVQRHWMDNERQYRNLFAQCQRSRSICDQIQARTLVLLGARVRKYVVKHKFSRTSRTMGYCRIADWWHVQVSHFLADMSSNRAIIAWTVEERRKKLPFSAYFRQRNFSSEPCW